MSDHAARMYSQAMERIHDADILAQSLDSQSDSQAIIRILGFEVLLKCAALLSLGKIPRLGHGYFQLWEKLPAEASNEIMRIALAHMPGHSDLNQMKTLLDAYEFIFKRARYYYELYEGRTKEQVREAGERWIANGAKTEDAAVVYYPNELSCLIEGLSRFIARRLGA